MAFFEERKTKDGKVRHKAQVRLKGHPIQTATFERLTDARRWAKSVESAMLEGRHFKSSESKKRTFKELIERYEREVLPTKPRAKQESQYTWWKEQLGRFTLVDITPNLIGEYRDKLLTEPLSTGKARTEGTVIRYLAALSHAFSVARDEWGWVEQSPVEKVRKPSAPRGRVRFLSSDERARLLDACKISKNPFLYSIVILALSTGMRKSEILNLRWPDVDFERGRITIHETKNGERRSVPLAGLALQILKEIREKDSASLSYIFWTEGSQKLRRPIDIRSAWESTLKRAEVKDFTLHGLRHSAASYLAMNGATLIEIAEILGHKTLNLVKRYSHLSQEHTSKVVSRMNHEIFGH